MAVGWSGTKGSLGLAGAGARLEGGGMVLPEVESLAGLAFLLVYLVKLLAGVVLPSALVAKRLGASAAELPGALLALLGVCLTPQVVERRLCSCLTLQLVVVCWRDRC